MGTLVDKLQKTLNSKKMIKAAIEKRGVYVGNAPFGDYPKKIADICTGTTEEWKEADWIDITRVLNTDEETYTYKSIYLLTDEVDTITLAGGEAYKTSDSGTLITEGGEYTFTGAGDVACGIGYKTRYLIVYGNSADNNFPEGITPSVLWAVIDGKSFIKSSAFQNAHRLRYVQCLGSIQYIGNGAFRNCVDLVWFVGANNASYIDDYAFYGCINLRGVDFIASTVLRNGAFQHCISLDEVEINVGNGYKSNSAVNAFDRARINKLRIFGLYSPNVINTLRFYYTSVKHLVIEDGCTVYPRVQILSDYIICCRELNIPPSVKELDYLSLSSLTNLNVTLPAGITSLPNYSFYICANLESVGGIESIETIEYCCFCSCDRLKELTLPKVKVLTGYNTIYNCKSLRKVSMPILAEIKLYANNTYKNAFCSLESLEELLLPELKTVNAFNVISDLPLLKTLSLPKLESVSSYFIYSCDSLEEFTVPKGLKAFGSNFIYNCKSLKRVTFEDGFCGKYSATYLFNYAVCNCANLEYIYLPASIDMDDNATTTATYHIGSGCPNVTTVELGQGYKQTLYLNNMPNLSHDSLLQNLNALADLTGQTAKKLVLGSVNLAKLTDEEKAIATNKNWTLS